VATPRPLNDAELEALLTLDIPGRLGTLDKEGYPHITPIWFVWERGAFFMTSLPDKAHVHRLEREPRASFCVDVEDAERDDGERPNRSVRAVGPAELFDDTGGAWTRRITEKYLRGPGLESMLATRTAQDRVVIRFQPVRLFGLSSV
jgi:nitroimidazol reductase NimA-like FMN-containing flavoprotein (pyridoxamine 5'-phosphate oxidase superfamily)